jgi:hypothetical protein
MLSARSVRASGWLLPALLGGFLAFGSTPSVAHAQKKPAKAAAGKASKNAAPAANADKAEEAKRADARKNYAEGEAKLAVGDYAGAFKAYKAANELIPASAALYKMGVCVDKQNKPTEAVTAYEAFLGSNPPEKMQDKVSEVRARVAELKKKIGPPAVKVTSDPAGANVAVDGVAQVGVTPVDVKLAPGHHKIRVTTSGYTGVTKEVDVEAGVPKTVDVILPKEEAVAAAPLPTSTAPAPVEAPPQPPTETQPEHRSNVVAYVLLGVAGAGAVVGSVFGIQALGDKSDFNNKPADHTNEKADSVEKNALISDMAFGAALTLGVTGVVLLLSNSSSSSSSTPQAKSAPQQAFGVVPVVSLDRAGAAATIRF